MFSEQLKFYINNFTIIQKLVPTFQEGFDSKWERKSKFEQFYDTLFIATSTVGQFTGLFVLIMLMLLKTEWETNAQRTTAVILMILLSSTCGVVVFFAPLIRQYSLLHHVLSFDKKLTGTYLINEIADSSFPMAVYVIQHQIDGEKTRVNCMTL